MKRRHEKIKPHLIEQYQRQRFRIIQAANYGWLALYMNYTDAEEGTIFSERFKK